MTSAAAIAEHVTVRDMTAEHKDLVYDSWLRSYKTSAGVRPGIYYKGQRALIGHILWHSRVRVATPQDDSHTVYGWICSGRAGALHYIYVRQTYRRFGVGKLLLADMAWVPRELRPTHNITHLGALFLARHKVGEVDPYLAYFPEL